MPCSFVSPCGPTQLELVKGQGVVSIVPVHINANLTCSTVEQLVGRKKDIHMAAFRHTVQEVRMMLDDMRSLVAERMKREINSEEVVDVQEFLDGVVRNATT